MLTSKSKEKEGCAFMENYQRYCKTYSVNTNAMIKVKFPNKTLEFMADRLKFDEWKPLLLSFRRDSSVHYISIKSRQSVYSYLDHVTTENAASQVKSGPVIFTKYMMSNLCDSLSSCLSVSTALTCLQLDGLPLRESTTESLSKGLNRTESLQNLSIRNCDLGDAGCLVVTRALRFRPSIIALELINCSLTSEGCKHIADLIKSQRIGRASEAWKHNLRYREVRLETFPGLRRINLSENSDIGDKGVGQLVEVLLDDNWIKAIDMPYCGITDVGANSVLELVTTNKNIFIFDLRKNNISNADLMKNILLRLGENTKGDTEYKWINVEQLATTISRISISSAPSCASRAIRAHRSAGNVHSGSERSSSRSRRVVSTGNLPRKNTSEYEIRGNNTLCECASQTDFSGPLSENSSESSASVFVHTESHVRFVTEEGDGQRNQDQETKEAEPKNGMKKMHTLDFQTSSANGFLELQPSGCSETASSAPKQLKKWTISDPRGLTNESANGFCNQNLKSFHHISSDSSASFCFRPKNARTLPMPQERRLVPIGPLGDPGSTVAQNSPSDGGADHASDSSSTTQFKISSPNVQLISGLPSCSRLEIKTHTILCQSFASPPPTTNGYNLTPSSTNTVSKANEIAQGR